MYPSLALVTAFKPCEPAGRYESRFTHANASRCSALLERHSPVFLSHRMPSSRYMLMPHFSALVSTKGQSKKSPL